MLLLVPLCAQVQRKDARDVVHRVLGELKTMQQVSYSYEMSVSFPDGTRQKLKGQVHMNNKEKEMYNDNDLQTVIYTSRWSYKANHSDKEVVIVNNEKHLSKNYRAEMERQMFQNTALGFFLDSIVMRSALVKRYEKKHDTIDIDLSFPEEYAVKGMHFSYDDGKKQLISYSMMTYESDKGYYTGKDNTGTSHNIKCSGFNTADTKQFRTDNYFLVSNNKVTLKKYTGYKVNSKLYKLLL